MNNDLVIGGTAIGLGESVTLELPIAKLYTHANVAMPLQVIRGKKLGPTLFVSAAIHGDELNGVEIIRRLRNSSALSRIRGTLIAIPIVNIYGFISHSRYLPDRRDLNRSFPGSDHGSLAARLAHLFVEQIIKQCTHGIDIHTGAIHRSNLPQVRADLSNEETERLARIFGVPVVINANSRDGSLREAAADLGVPTLLYEAGEALRFDEVSIRAGVRGVLNVMRELEMLPRKKSTPKLRHEPFIARSSTWVRASSSGVMRSVIALGAKVDQGTLLGMIADPFGTMEVRVTSPQEGIVIGRTNLPLANEGDALFHIARFSAVEKVAAKVEEFHEIHTPESPDESTTPGSPII